MGTRTSLLACATSLLSLALLVPAAPASAADPLRLEGRGFGHGIGLSQYGAQAAATQGVGWQEILRTYYPGTDLGSVGGEVSVLVSRDDDGDTQVRARKSLRLTRVDSGRSWSLERLDRRADQWRVGADEEGRSVLEALRGRRWRVAKRFAGDAEFTAPKPITLVTPTGATAYRGTLRSAAVDGDPTERDTVNHVRLEDYLRGVVPREVPALWRPDAVRAQAVAARTYAAYERTEPLAGHYEICDTDRCQVYGGADAEHPASDDAIRETRGVAVVRDGAPVFAQFSASNGGYSVAGPFDYLPARPDAWDPYTWEETVSVADLETAFDTIGDYQRIEVVERDGRGEWGGRVTRVTLLGSDGSTTVSGDTFRVRLGLRSTLFREAP
jgi:SpoIID/LytB domain protein